MRRRIQLIDVIKSFAVILAFFIVLITPLVAYIISCNISYNNVKKLVEEIKDNPSVLNVKIFNLEAKNYRYFHHLYSFRIFFNTGGNIVVRDVNQWGKSWKETPMRLHIVDDYIISF